MIGLHKANNYLLSQRGNADEMPLHFDLPPKYTVDDNGAISVPIKNIRQ
jgi:hypothetical protein